MLLRGKISPIHTVEPTDALALALEIPETGHKSVEVAILSKAEISYRDDKVKMRDPQGRDLLLRLKYKCVVCAVPALHMLLTRLRCLLHVAVNQNLEERRSHSTARS